MRKTFAVFTTLVLALAVVGGLRSTRQEAHASGPVEWPIAGKDALAWKGIDGQLLALDAQVAPIVSDAKIRRAIYDAVMRIQWEADELQAEVSREKGVAVVRSGSVWVTRK